MVFFKLWFLDNVIVCSMYFYVVLHHRIFSCVCVMSGLQCSEMVRARICNFIFKSTSCAEVVVSSVDEDLICVDHCALF